LEFVHQKCLSMWVKYSHSSQCEVCRYKYVYEYQFRSRRQIIKRQLKQLGIIFVCLVIIGALLDFPNIALIFKKCYILAHDTIFSSHPEYEKIKEQEAKMDYTTYLVFGLQIILLASRYEKELKARYIPIPSL
jgi:hypothetical protein